MTALPGRHHRDQRPPSDGRGRHERCVGLPGLSGCGCGSHQDSTLRTTGRAAVEPVTVEATSEYFYDDEYPQMPRYEITYVQEVVNHESKRVL